MKLYYNLTIVLLLLLGVSCTTLKAVKYIKSGVVNKKKYKTEVPFRMQYGTIVIKVMIHGKEYHFILDSGAPTVISKELAQQLGIKAVGYGKGGDSQGNSEEMGYATIDSLGIGDLQFLNFGVAITDLNQSKEVACFHIDGLIGATLMRKAVWQIDYEHEMITICNDRNMLPTPAHAQHVKFHYKLTGIPLIDVQVNEQMDKDVIVDLGSNADYYSSYPTFNALMQQGLITNMYSYGYGAAGIFGRGKQDTSWIAIVHDIKFGDVILKNQAVTFCHGKPKTIGTNFLKNYTLIFDWSANELTMIPHGTYNNLEQRIYDFSLVLKDKHVYIGTLFYNGKPHREGPQLGDQVLEIDGKDYRSCDGEKWCDLLSERFDKSTNSVKLLVKHGEQEISYQLDKTAFFLK